MNRSELNARAERARQTCLNHGIVQMQIARDLGASQPQVSRILSGNNLRYSRLFEEVCLYVECFEGGVTAEAVQRNVELIEAVRSVWNGSAAHARALSSVIRTLAALGSPASRKIGVGP